MMRVYQATGGAGMPGMGGMMGDGMMGGDMMDHGHDMMANTTMAATTTTTSDWDGKHDRDGKRGKHGGKRDGKKHDMKESRPGVCIPADQCEMDDQMMGGISIECGAKALAATLATAVAVVANM